jgi:hypothetical protein
MNPSGLPHSLPAVRNDEPATKKALQGLVTEPILLLER